MVAVPGARTLLGAVASSTIGVAGTVFSITIAALSLAAGQMGPRLLRNFTRDRGNQLTLGVFLGTFSYALMVLRSIRSKDEGDFIPHLSLSVGILLAFVCVCMLVYFVGHMAGRINVDTVIGLVDEEVRQSLHRFTVEKPEPDPPPADFWRDAIAVSDHRSGYLQQLDEAALAEWAAAQGVVVLLLVRPGDYIFPGAPIARLLPDAANALDAIHDATATGPQRVSSGDLEFSIRQLVEVAVRALSPGINDPHTAMSVLDKLGAALCFLAPRHLKTGVTLQEGQMALVRPSISYDGLVDSMFQMIRQNASTSTAVMMRLLEVLTAAARCERRPERLATLSRHANLVASDAEANIGNLGDLIELQGRHAVFAAVVENGPLGDMSSACQPAGCARAGPWDR